MHSSCPQCVFCSHFDLESIDDSTVSAMKCRAFPEGIPAEILLNKHDHRQAYPDDRNIRFTFANPEDLHPLELARMHT